MDIINSSLSKEYTEDGDVCFTVTTVANFSGARAWSDRESENRHWDGTWTAIGNGMLKTSYNYTVCGTSYAIEQSNDAWASNQQAIEDDAQRRSLFG